MRERLQARGFSAQRAWSGLASAVAPAGRQRPPLCPGAATRWPQPSPATPASCSCGRWLNVPASSAWSLFSAPRYARPPGAWPRPGNHGVRSPASGISWPPAPGAAPSLSLPQQPWL